MKLFSSIKNKFFKSSTNKPMRGHTTPLVHYDDHDYMRNVDRDARLYDEHHNLIEDPVLTALVNEAWNTGELVIWNEGDPLPTSRSSTNV